MNRGMWGLGATRRKALISLVKASICRGNRPWFRVTSASMAPVVRPGDRVRVEFARPEDVAVGELLVVERNDELVVHRLIHRVGGNEGTLITAGDAGRWPDAPLAPDHLLGRVVAVSRRGRRMASPGRLRSRVRAFFLRTRFATKKVVRWGRNRLTQVVRKRASR